MMRIVPVTLKYAQQFVDDYHRHHNAPQGCKFAIGLMGTVGMCGVAICGRPVSRRLDDGETLEITRLCTNGVRNGCSMLYGGCKRVAKAMGYKRIITYTLISENGASLKASGFTDCGEAGGTHWTGERNRGQKIPAEMKRRWEIIL